jgi:pimeloyl-ACP methyl ester carboxylesterase
MGLSNSLTKLAALAGCLIASVGTYSVAAQSNGPPDLTPFTSPQLMVTIPERRRINLVCSGEGSPTVILTAGLSGWSANWLRVQADIAKLTRVCAWDRAGFGFSDPRAEPLDIARSSEDLEQALAGAGVSGPYVLVGHSMGGLESLLFADRHVSELAGLVLVDPSFPDQYQRFAKLAPYFTEEAARGRAQAGAAALACAQALTALAVEVSRPPNCPPTVPPFYPAAIIAALTPLQAEPQRVLTQSSMVTEMVHDTELAVNPNRTYGSIPLIVLSAPADDATVPPGAPVAFAFAPGTDPRIFAEIPILARAMSAGHSELALLSSNGSKRVVRGVGHQIPLIRPDLVISTVNEVIERARRGG